MSPKHTIQDRLRSLMDGRAATEVADRTGFHVDSVRRYIGGQKPSLEFLTAVCHAYGVSAEWLLEGFGEPHQDEAKVQALREADPADLLVVMAEQMAELRGRVERMERRLGEGAERGKSKPGTRSRRGRKRDGTPEEG